MFPLNPTHLLLWTTIFCLQNAAKDFPNICSSIDRVPASTGGYDRPRRIEKRVKLALKVAKGFVDTKIPRERRRSGILNPRFRGNFLLNNILSRADIVYFAWISRRSTSAAEYWHIDYLFEATPLLGSWVATHSRTSLILPLSVSLRHQGVAESHREGSAG